MPKHRRLSERVSIPRYQYSCIRRYSLGSPHLPARDRYLADLFAPLPMRAIVVYRRREWYRQPRINTRHVFIRSTWELA